MDKLREGEPSITVDGEPLADHLEKEEGKEKTNELEATRKEEIATKSKHKKKIRPRERFEDDPARVSKRVRHLSPFEIRKEYGVKERPFPTLNQNVLFTLFNAGDALINSRAISVEIGKPLADTSSALSHIWNKLKDSGMIYRKRVGLAYQYCMTNDALELGFEALFRKFWKTTPVKVREIITTPGERSGAYAHYPLKYKRTSKNIIDLIAQTMSEQFSASEIARGVGKPPANISSTLQMLIKRLTPHNMLKLTGSRATRLYQLHPDLAGIDGADLIDFIQSPKKHYEKTLEDAWNFWKSKGFGVDAPPPPDPVIPPPPDPAEYITVTAAQVTQFMEPLLQRLEALEQDGLEGQVEKLHEIYQKMDGKLSDLSLGLEDTIKDTEGAFDSFKRGVKADIKDIFDLENKAPGEFNINFNVRFLFGR